MLSESDLLSEVGLVDIKGNRVLEKLPGYTTYDMLMTSDYLVFCNGIANPNYYDVLDLNEMKYLGSVGHEGGGPSEFAGVLRTSVLNSNILSIHSSAMGQRMYQFNLDSALKNSSYEVPKVFDYDQPNVQRSGWIGNGYYVQTNLRDTARLTVIDESGKTINKFLKYPFEEELQATRTEVYGMIFQSALVTNSVNQRAALFNFNGPNWDIASFENPNSPTIVSQVHLRPIHYKDESEIEEKSRTYAVAIYTDNKKGFVDVTSTNSSIYAVYSGKSYEKYKDESDYGQVVLQLDWNGKLINRFKLDRPTKVICVNRDGSKLYAVVENDEFDSLYEYNLN
uniref:BF3164 family lipoprotein n=1 Tax=Roseivirga sp. TaxID=1964215 RepID=UPI0040473835